MSRFKASSRTVTAAYVAAALFAIHLVTYFIAPIRDASRTSSPLMAELLALLAVAEHLLVFPVVAALPAPGFAKAAGYGWLVIDMATDIMQLNGAPTTMYLTMPLWRASFCGTLDRVRCLSRHRCHARDRCARCTRSRSLLVYCVHSLYVSSPGSFIDPAPTLVVASRTPSCSGEEFRPGRAEKGSPRATILGQGKDR